MVSFSCEVCNDTVVKKKLGQHQQRCRGAYFTCIDCSTTFQNNDHDKHTSCISEAEKYEKGLYKGKKQKPKQPEQQQQQQQKKKSAPSPKKSTSQPEGSLSLFVTEKSNLYKVLKKASKDDKKKLKEILKKLTISKVDGKLIIQ